MDSLHQVVAKVLEAKKSPEETPLQETEEKFTSLALAFKTDSQTLDKRIELHLRARDVAERNIQKELESLKDGIKNLNQTCSSNPSTQQILSKIQNHLNVLEQSITRLSSRAEVHGAVQQELRVSQVIDAMVQHVENLKRTYQSEHNELQEARRSLQVTGSDSTDSAGGSKGLDRTSYSAGGSSKGSLRRISLALLANKTKYLRSPSLQQSEINFTPSTGNTFSSPENLQSPLFEKENLDSCCESPSEVENETHLVNRQSSSVCSTTRQYKPAAQKTDRNFGVDDFRNKGEKMSNVLSTLKESMFNVSEEFSSEKKLNRIKELPSERASVVKQFLAWLADLLQQLLPYSFTDSCSTGLVFLFGLLSKIQPLGFLIIILLLFVVTVFIWIR